MSYHFPLGGAATPAMLYASLTRFVDRARREIDEMRSALGSTPTEESPWSDICRADWELERDLVSFAGDVWGARFAADFLAHAPEFPEQPTVAALAQALRSEGSPEQRQWMTSVATEATRIVESVRVDPSSRSTSPSHNLREDYRLAFHARLLEELPLWAKIEALTAMDRAVRARAEMWERERAERERKAREERERQAEHDRQRRRERRSARKAHQALVAAAERREQEGRGQ